MDFGAILEDELAMAHSAVRSRRRLLLVEGTSDRAAVTTLADRRGQPFGDHGVVVVAMDGATNINRFLRVVDGDQIHVYALCDRAERTIFEEAFAAGDVKHDLFTCDRDLEDEMIRALGTDRVLQVIAETGELNSFNRMRAQPAQRNRALPDQLHRFIGTRSGRKIRYGQLLAAVLEPEEIPRTLAELLDVLL